MFVDIANIHLKAGNGGNGAVSFRREKYVAAGGPDGGDGGKGGDIVFKVDDNLSTLADFRYKRKYAAENGEDGKTRHCAGKKAPDLLICVPRGTIVKEQETGRIIADLSDDKSVVIAKGGNGGWGNQHFSNATRQIPRFAKNGNPGEEIDVTLELKLLADVGLIGFPNVGKSTFLSVVSDAKPNIANYHFTTLTPVLGVIRMGEGSSFVMADIPGLIEGASEGVGLGHEFLRHVDRCRLLVHVIDISGSEGRDPIDDFEKINSELAAFNEELTTRPQVIVGNKCDLIDEDEISKYEQYFESRGYKFFPAMAAIAEGTADIINYVAAELAKLPAIKVYEAEPKPQLDLTTNKKRTFNIRACDGVFFVEDAPWIMDVMNQVDPDDYESLQYFERVMRQTGIIDALRKAGVQEGDTVSVYDVEFDFVD